MTKYPKTLMPQGILSTLSQCRNPCKNAKSRAYAVFALAGNSARKDRLTIESLSCIKRNDMKLRKLYEMSERKKAQVLIFALLELLGDLYDSETPDIDILKCATLSEATKTVASKSIELVKDIFEEDGRWLSARDVAHKAHRFSALPAPVRTHILDLLVEEGFIEAQRMVGGYGGVGRPTTKYRRTKKRRDDLA